MISFDTLEYLLVFPPLAVLEAIPTTACVNSSFSWGWQAWRIPDKKVMRTILSALLFIYVIYIVSSHLLLSNPKLFTKNNSLIPTLRILYSVCCTVCGFGTFHTGFAWHWKPSDMVLYMHELKFFFLFFFFKIVYNEVSKFESEVLNS